MLKEFKQVRQIKGDAKRRWFNDEIMDLIVWYDKNGTISGFQLCYGYPRNSHAFTWETENVFRHEAVDWGESDRLWQKATPILVQATHPFDAGRVLGQFRNSAQMLDPELKELVEQKIEEFTNMQG